MKSLTDKKCRWCHGSGELLLLQGTVPCGECSASPITSANEGDLFEQMRATLLRAGWIQNRSATNWRTNEREYYQWLGKYYIGLYAAGKGLNSKTNPIFAVTTTNNYHSVKQLKSYLDGIA